MVADAVLPPELSMRRPKEYNGPGRKCPKCRQYWPITMDPRCDNEPVKDGECAACGQQVPEPQISSDESDDPSLLVFTSDEIIKGIKGVHLGKAADAAGVVAEMFKIGGWAEEDLTNLINDMIATGEIPTAWTQAMIIPLYKNKGDAAMVTNYRAIVITDIISKVFARAIFNLLNEEIEPKLMESQAGFRRGRSLTDHVFVMRQMMEAAKEYDKPLYTAFIDIAKAYDGIPRQALLAVLRRYGVSDRLCQLAHYHAISQDICQGSRGE